MQPKDITIQDYTYVLPDEKIAHYPLPQRDASKLLIHRSGHLSEDIFRHIDRHLPEGSLFVFNNTKVVEARLLFQKPTGARVEIFCLEPHRQYPDITTAMLQTGKVWWQCLIGGASKWKQGQVLEKKIPAAGEEPPILLQARYLGKERDDFTIELSWSPAGLSFATVLHRAGVIPLPPYMKRQAERTDAERYQTIYAHEDGSVAAPTAGLHFTETIFGQLEARHIQRCFVTLHVGAGTFKPVKAGTLGQHEMHAEFIDVDRDAIGTIKNSLDGTVIPVGTTSLRTIESLYWLGVKTHLQPQLDPSGLTVQQWDAYELPAAIPPAAALESLLAWMDQHRVSRLITRTQLLILPGYDWKITGALVTNFHQPQSTLLLLVAALVGEEWKAMYEYALKNDFRFLSYGDGCLLFRP